MSVSFSKVIPIGDAGSLTIAEAEGVANVKVELSKAAGGGSTAGFLKGSIAAEFDLDARELVDAGFALAEKKYPGVAAFLEAARKAIDAQLVDEAKAASVNAEAAPAAAAIPQA